MPLRIVFMGTPEFSVNALTALGRAGHVIVAIYTQPPRPAGRGMEMRKSPVHEIAEKLGIPVSTPASLKAEAEHKAFAALKADVAIVVAYGLILPKVILDAPRFGCFNIHASLLPRWRGAAPIQRAIMAGDSHTGVAIMRMEAGLDTGPVALRETVAIGANMTAGELHDNLAELGAELMVRAAAMLEQGRLTLEPQSNEGVTYAAKIGKGEARIDWVKSAREVHAHICGLSPSPGAWSEIPIAGKPERVKILASNLVPGNGVPGTVLGPGLVVACGEGAVRLLQLQRAGRDAQGAGEFLRGARIETGARLA